jgi:mannose-6-phosphate isomerase-like protein (cupin superfamily)
VNFVLRVLGAVLLIAPLCLTAQTPRGGAPAGQGAAAAPLGPPKFIMWTAEELKRRDEALQKAVGANSSSRETLGQFINQRFRLIHRTRDGGAEVHENEVDVIIVQSGEGTLVVGGTLVRPAGAGNRGGATVGQGQAQGRAPAGGRGRAGGGDDGVAGATIQGGERYALKVGDVAHIPAKVPHWFLPAPGKTLTYIAVKFPPPPLPEP